MADTALSGLPSGTPVAASLLYGVVGGNSRQFPVSDLPLIAAVTTPTDNALVRWDGTTGKLVQNSANATLSDNWALTLAGAAVTADEPIINISQTWNNGAVGFTGIKANFTNTASATATNFFDFQLAGVSQLRLTKAMHFVSAQDIAFAPAAGGDFVRVTMSNSAFSLTSIVCQLDSSSGLRWGNSATLPGLQHQTVTGGWGLRFASSNNANGQGATVENVTELLTIAAAASTDTTIDIPAGVVVLGVSVRNTVAIPTAATYTVTGATTGTVFATGVLVAVNTTDKGNLLTPYLNAAAQKVRITPNATPGANTGRVRVTVHYINIVPPTS